MEAETTATIGRRVQELRKRQGLTGEKLAALMTEQGVPWERFVLTKLETGRRHNVTVVELLALARVLNVSPLHLMVPLADEGTFQTTPTESVPPAAARAWIRGEQPLPGTDLRIFRTEVPLDELGQS